MSYKPFSLKAALELASPPTWVASIGPCFIAGAFAVCCALQFSALQPGEDPALIAQMGVVLDWRSALSWVLILLCSVLMQSATNTLNDYQDYKNGLDTAETILDETDASIVYNRINPRSALHFANGLLAVAAVLGALVIVLSGSITLLVLGLVSALVVVLYSFGPKPISSLPVGEAVSGIVMGGILTCATFYATTLSFAPVVLAVAVLPTISIAQIMLTNNTCDRERDLSVGRKTLPGRIGLKRSRSLNAGLGMFTYVWLALVMVWAGLYWGVLVALAGLLGGLPKINRLLKGPYDLQNRQLMMGTVVSYNRWLDVTAASAILFGGIISALI